MKELLQIPHRRKNILTGEWVLVSPHRTKRPWQGAEYTPLEEVRPSYVEDCYLCPGNMRANGDRNPDYKSTFIFTNDFSSLLINTSDENFNKDNLLIAKSEKGICRVVNFSPRHDLTLAEMKESDIVKVLAALQEEYREFCANPDIKHVQIFENKGELMGNSNPHPHCQIWAQSSIPMEALKEGKNLKSYFRKRKTSLLSDYLKLELELQERVVYENNHFAAVVPFWAVWPFETLIIPKHKVAAITALTEDERKSFANIIKAVTVKYDNLFKISFPYSSGIHQQPSDGKEYEEWHMHMHFYPPLLRSASIKKFMVGYEMLAEPQRDLTPEYCASVLKKLSVKHYKSKK